MGFGVFFVGLFFVFFFPCISFLFIFFLIYFVLFKPLHKKVIQLYQLCQSQIASSCPCSTDSSLRLSQEIPQTALKLRLLGFFVLFWAIIATATDFRMPLIITRLVLNKLCEWNKRKYLLKTASGKTTTKKTLFFKNHVLFYAIFYYLSVLYETHYKNSLHSSQLSITWVCLLLGRSL